MKRKTLTLLAALLCAGLLYSNCHAQAADAKLYQGFGDFHRSISAASPDAQKWFDQGMQLLYGFNHDEAIRSFHAAAEADPSAAMPWWGIAYAHGININDPQMTDERSQAARQAADKALARIATASPPEAALIRAVSARYQYPAPEDRKPLDLAYADAMGKAYASHPGDADIAALFGDSLMNLQPWDYWDNQGNAKGRTLEIVAALEAALKNDPFHPGANHFYIHTVEASSNPDRAEASADRLRTLVPGAGHLVHMPSHIYVRVGRYSDAVDSNAQAVEADRSYFSIAPEPSMYFVYYAHNLHFLSYAAMMSGRYQDAITAARDLEREMPEPALKDFAFLIEGIMPTTLHVMIRFGKWEEILEEPAYPEFRLVSNAVRHYARSIANSALGRTQAARAEMAAFETAMAAVPEDWHIFNNPVAKVLPIARAMIEGELLYREGNYDQAFAILRQGIAAEDALVYDEPPGWMLPVRHALGALLMEQKRYAEAEAVYREDLTRNRDNGWGLLGLQNALRAQKKNPAEAIHLSGQLAEAWIKADTLPGSSCYCAPASL
ncbi:tetratricopeptide repeat domain protein [Verrucomicrobiia bacterium DG1235]|nr:tetratricopeptide repeat domain protein [Verrucomicrobiae bacterium DG1235]